MITKLLEKAGLKEKIYTGNECPEQKNGEHYAIFNSGKASVIYNNAHVYEMASAGGPGGWGNHIAWDGNPCKGEGIYGQIVGFSHRIPRVGELIVSRLESGYYYYFAITKIRRCKDPHDAFFADVRVLQKFTSKLTTVKTMN